MDIFIKKIGDALNSGDEEVRTWFLVRNNYLPLTLCVFYTLFSTFVGPALMKHRKPFELRPMMVLFNFFLVATYTISLAIIFWYLPKLQWEEFCKAVIVKKGNIAYTLATTGWVLYILKYIEFLDTVFFVLRKKENQITFLHVLHHTAVPILVWIGLRTEKSGMQGIPGIINSVIHVIMYSYYGLSAMGPSVRKHLWWKKYLTQLQIIQFCIIIFFVAVVVPLSGCTMVFSSYLMDIVFAPLFLYLFYKFYKSSFKSKEKIIEINGSIDNGKCKNGVKKIENSTNGKVTNGTFTNGTSKKHE